MADGTDTVTLTIDGKEVTVPKGTNLIEAAKAAGVEVPYYCYHPDLSIAGNCRMCQVHIEGARKLEIACNCEARDEMVVSTHETNEEVANAQRATLEFLLINHPLDCTVCDEAGHCKLQDYYYQYNAKASRFTDNKVNQVKAEPLGPEIIFDGERCIVCTRCVRFCEEVTKTGELGVFNRGDKAVIGIANGKELDNPLDGSVVDLCPVGALTHRRWRFNTRIWYTSETDTLCTGCSTGCSAKVAVRDNRIVFVKARLNEAINKEWMCNEGRYGFERFQPNERLVAPLKREGGVDESIDWDAAATTIANLKTAGGADSEKAAMFLSPFLTLEEIWQSLEFADRVMGISHTSDRLAMQLRKREVGEIEQFLVSPDYAPNARAATLFGVSSSRPEGQDDWRAALEGGYARLLEMVRSGSVNTVLLVGDYAIADADVDTQLISALQNARCSVALSPRGVGVQAAERGCQLVLPSRTVNEKDGVMVNKMVHFQRLRRLLDAPQGSEAEWMLLRRMADVCGKTHLPASVATERDLFMHMVSQFETLGDLSLMKIGELGISLEALHAGGSDAEQVTGRRV